MNEAVLDLRLCYDHIADFLPQLIVLGVSPVRQFLASGLVDGNRLEEAVAIAANRNELGTALVLLADRVQTFEVFRAREPLLEVSLFFILEEAVVGFLLFLIDKVELVLAIELLCVVALVALGGLLVLFLDAHHCVAGCCKSSHFHGSVFCFAYIFNY